MESLTPNYTKGRAGQRPEAIVLHITDGAFEGAISWLKNPISKASAHFVISYSGKTVQLVDTDDTAWHAGTIKNPRWHGLKQGINPNLYTIGIECEGTPNVLPTFKQYAKIVEIVRELSAKYHIPLDTEHIIAHRQIRSDKTCPGDNILPSVITFLARLR